MTTESPIACSLGANEYATRLAAMAEIGAASLRKAYATTDHAVLRFATDAGTRRRLEAIVAAERDCCSFLRMSLRDGEFLDLRIEAPPSAEPILREIVGAFRGERTVA